MVTVRLVELNNKSRKGTYVYVKEKGHRGDYFKLKDNVPLDAYKEYYEDKHIKEEKKGTIKDYIRAYSDEDSIPATPLYKQSKEYLKKIRKKGTILSEIKKGKSIVVINNVKTAGNTQIKNANIELLKDLVLDKGLLEVLVKEENLKKLRSRFEHRISIKDGENNVLLTGSSFMNTVNEIVRKLQTVKSEQVTKDEYWEEKSGISKFLTEIGFKDLQIMNKGKVSKITLTTIFRRG